MGRHRLGPPHAAPPRRRPPLMSDPALDDARSSRPEERLLEESWAKRSRSTDRRELLVETSASVLFLALALPLALSALANHHMQWGLALALVVLYALSSRVVKFPLGAGYVVPSYMVLVPMLLLLPPGTVPVLAAAASRAARSRSRSRAGPAPSACCSRSPTPGTRSGRPPCSSPPAPSRVAGARTPVHRRIPGGLPRGPRLGDGPRGAILGVASRVQIRVIALVWLIDACIAPIGLLLGWRRAQAPRRRCCWCCPSSRCCCCSRASAPRASPRPSAAST